MKIKGRDNSINIGNAKHVKIIQNNSTESINEISDEISSPMVTRTELKKLPIAPKKMTLVSALTFASTLISILGLFIKFPILELPFFPLQSMLLFMSVCGTVMLVGVALQKQRFMLLFRNRYLKSDNKQVMLMKAKIQCPECDDSEMRLCTVENIGLMALCERNPEDHRIKVDFTKL